MDAAVCSNGHPLATGHQVCPSCGAPRVPTPPRRVLAVPAGSGSWVPAAAALTLLAAIGAVGVAALGDPGRVLRGTLTLPDPDSYRRVADGCVGADGFDDIHAGLPVTVTGAAGRRLGVGELAAGTPSGRGCVFAFTVLDLPAADGYDVEVGDRGVVAYTRAELDGSGWTVSFTLD